MPSTSPPERVFGPAGQRRPPRGVLWATGAARFHAQRGGHYAGTDWSYYRGRRLACPYRCALGSRDCPVDVLLVEINRPIKRPSARPPAAPGLPGSR